MVTITKGVDSENKQDALLPLIPLEPLLKDSPAKLETACSLLKAFERDGFFYLTDFADVVPQTLVKSVFTHSAQFFARPQEQKDALEWDGPRSNRGYTGSGREKNSRALTKEDVSGDRLVEGQDLKESLEIGRSDEEGHPNQWPHDGSEDTTRFTQTMQDMFLRCKEVHKILMRGIAVAMRLDETFFDDFVRQGDNTLRLLHYPSVPRGGFEGGRRVRAGAHSDYGSVTLLFQDARGGLQVERPGQSGWFNVVPREGTIVVNAGDLLARWSNDLIRSTVHQVVEPPGQQPDEGHPPRYSVAYFCNPDFDKFIDVLPGTFEGKEGGKKYPGVNSGDYLEQRLTATY